MADSPLVVAARGELEAAGKLDTRLGQQALTLAARMSHTETTAGIAALSRELRNVMAAALGSSQSDPAARNPPDFIDEIRARRDAKRKA